jgi:predicted RNase H-like nuclease
MKQENTGIWGVDACRGGWIARGAVGWVFATDFSALMQAVHPFCMLVDIPIGLSGDGYLRETDAYARRELGRRGASVFNAPCRKAVYAVDYPSANKINRIETGKGLSKQSWNICRRIREVDTLLREQKHLQDMLFESHPELNFKRLNGNIDLQYSKKQVEGREERLQILSRHYAYTRQQFQSGMQQFQRQQVQADDLLDAMCLHVVGQLGFYPLPEAVQRDACGIPVAYRVPLPA